MTYGSNFEEQMIYGSNYVIQIELYVSDSEKLIMTYGSSSEIPIMTYGSNSEI